MASDRGRIEHVSTVSDKDYLWDVLTVRYGRSQEARARIGEGATVPAMMVQARGRAMFSDQLWQLAPHVLMELLSPEMYELWKQPEQAALANAIVDWQNKHALPDGWISDAAIRTIDAYDYFGFFQDPPPDEPLHAWDVGLCLMTQSDDGSFAGNLYHGKERQEPLTMANRNRRVLFSHEYIDIPISIFDLRYPELVENDSGWEWEDDGSLGTFDPRTETIDNAVKRMLPELERRLRHSLELHVDDDKTWNDAIPPVTYRSTKAFERLVRFQVLGESRNQIAIADGIKRQNVSTQVNETARLIGLTLRDAHSAPSPSNE